MTEAARLFLRFALKGAHKDNSKYGTRCCVDYFVQVEDPVQCDKYYVCETDGKLVPKLCQVSDLIRICLGAIAPFFRTALCTTFLESLATTHKGLDS